MTFPRCRFCRSDLRNTFVDLGMSPLSNGYLSADQLSKMEPFYPLHARVCGTCFLVQVEEFEAPQEIFTDYAYFSSFSSTWLEHARHYADSMVERCKLGAQSLVIEIGSNDGYLLQYFLSHGVSVLGVEPAQNVAKAAEARGVPTVSRFFGLSTAQELVGSGRKPDLIVANNVLAHVPDLNNFVAGLKAALKTKG